jgi:hypothetical protein
VGWSDLGWAMENLWAVSMERQFFCMSTVGPPNKNPCMSTSKNKDINSKSKQNYPNYQMQMMLLKLVLCLYNKKWSNHSKYNQLESSSVCQFGGIMYVNTVPVYICTMFIPASIFYYKSVFSQFRLGGS